MGLMQVMPELVRAAGFNPNNMYDIEENIQFGAFWLDKLFKEYDFETAVKMYLCGETKKECLPANETKEYLSKIISEIERLNGEKL